MSLSHPIVLLMYNLLYCIFGSVHIEVIFQQLFIYSQQNSFNVLGSPFTCSVSDVGRVLTPTEDKISLGKLATFKVDCGSLGPPQVIVSNWLIVDFNSRQNAISGT